MRKTEFSSPDGQFIECAIRLKSILCIKTNFDPFRYIDLAEHIASSTEIKSFSAVNIHEDGTGYWLFSLHDGYNPEMLIDDVSIWFNHFEF